MPRVSAVMPVYNVAPFVGEAIASLLEQTFRDFELLVIDDGSTDGTVDVVREFDDPRIRLVQSSHTGLVGAENLGLDMAAGEYVVRPDGDDVYLPELFERQVGVLDAEPEVAAVGVWVRQFGGRQEYWRTPTDPRAILRKLRRGRNPVNQPVMMRAAAARSVGGYRPVELEDVDLWVRLAARYRFRTVPECLALHRFRPDSWTYRRSPVEEHRALLRARLAAGRHLGLRPILLANLADSALAVASLRVLGGGRRAPTGPPPAATLPSATVVVTTVRRVALLGRCLAAVEAQLPRPDEVVVVHRSDDAQTVRFLRSWAAGRPDRCPVPVEVPGIVPALIAGTLAARGEVVAYLDDDAAPRPGWLEELRRAFLDPTVGAAGGRLVDHIDGREVTGTTRTVGKVTWYGRVVGRHDLASDHYGDVEFLAGANMAFRRPLARHDPTLVHASTGLALANEFDACLTVRRLGFRVLYTPWAVVDHETTSFRDPRLGSRVVGEDVVTSAANYTYALLKYLSLPRRLAFLAYAYAVGSSMLPGPARVLLEAVRSPYRAAAMAARIGPAWRGRRLGRRAYRAWRRTGEPAELTVAAPDPGLSITAGGGGA
jgi:glycosyltransferase involved in cell wall biosynthesis